MGVFFWGEGPAGEQRPAGCVGAGYGVQDMGCAMGSRGGGDSEPCLVQPPPASRLPGKGLWCCVRGWVPGVSGEK